MDEYDPMFQNDVGMSPKVSPNLGVFATCLRREVKKAA